MIFFFALYLCILIINTFPGEIGFSSLVLKSRFFGKMNRLMWKSMEGAGIPIPNTLCILGSRAQHYTTMTILPQSAYFKLFNSAREIK